MLLRRSKQAASTPKRPQLAPLWVILPLAGMVALTLIIAFPQGDLVSHLIKAPDGPLTNAYLSNLLRVDPENPNLRLMLARNQMQTGELQLVAQTLAPALRSDQSKIREEAQWLLFRTDELRLSSMKLGPDRDRLKTELRQLLKSMIQYDQSEDRLTQMARSAFNLGDIEFGIAIFEKLASNGKKPSPSLYGETGKEALSQSEYRTSARFFLLAARQSDSLEEERKYFLSALASFASGELLAEGVGIAADYLAQSARLMEDNEILIKMVESSRAARRPDLADRYARQLLRLALLEQWRRTEWQLAHFGAVPHRTALKDESLKGGPQLPFDDRIYTLGFEAFLDNRKIDDAWKVAASAVQQAPEHALWRERLAKVSEWSGRPQTALKNWLILARQSNSEEAWQGVLRLAPGLFDDIALRDALQHNLEKHPDDQKLIFELAALHERLGDPKSALRLLEKRQAALNRSELLRAMAETAERIGDDTLALNYWRSFLDHPAAKPTVADALRIAVLHLLQGQDKEALTLLESFSNKASEKDASFWRLVAVLARQQDRESAAINAYHHLLSGPDAEENDFDANYALLLESHPLEAAKVAASGWRRFGTPRLLFNALNAYASAGAFESMGQLLREIDPARLPDLRRDPTFLRHSARYLLSRGDLAAARAKLEYALTLEPENNETQQALLWVFIESGDGLGLRRALSSWEMQWKADPRLYDVLAAAYLGLSRPEIALKRYLDPQLPGRKTDFLWQMNYADALEQNGDVDRAWRLRQHLLAEAGRKTPRQHWLTGAEAGEMRRIARSRLVLSQRPGDASNAVMRELLRLDRTPEGKLSDNAAIVATAWLQSANQFSAERGWLWARFARSASRPMWAEITIALAEDNREEAGRLLERHGEALPRHDRVNAARLVGDLRMAQTAAFDTQTDVPADDTLHLQLTETLLAHSDHAGAQFEKRVSGGINENEQSARWHLAITPRLTLDLSLGRIGRESRTPDDSGIVPDERFRTALLTWQHPDGTTRFGVESRHSFASYQPLLIEHEQRIDNRLSLNAMLGHHLQSSESTGLRLGGMRDRAALGLSYKPTQRDQFSLEYALERYHLQTGTKVGSGRHWQVEWRHALRLAQPDLEASIFWSTHRYKYQDDINDPALMTLLPTNFDPTTQAVATYFLPENFRYYGIRLSTDTRYEREYTRGWRSYASIARTWNSVSGTGYELFAGLAGSILGADHLRLGWSMSRGGRGTEGLTRQFGLYYRLHY